MGSGGVILFSPGVLLIIHAVPAPTQSGDRRQKPRGDANKRRAPAHGDAAPRRVSTLNAHAGPRFALEVGRVLIPGLDTSRPGPTLPDGVDRTAVSPCRG